MTLPELLHQDRFASPAHEALLNVIATESWLTGQLAATLAPYGVTPGQYNVLRILRGAHPHPHTCSAIGGRLLHQTPDVTRMLARLEQQGLITRCRAAHDRRVVEVAISEKGLALLERLDAPLEAAVYRLARHLGDDELRALSVLLERLRTDQRADWTAARPGDGGLELPAEKPVLD